MAGPFRLKRYSRKPTAGPLPRLPCDYLLTIDVDGVCGVYVEFWKPTMFGRKTTGWVQKTALDSFATDYFFSATPESLPVRDFGYAYSAVLANDHLSPACLTLLQLGMKGRIQLLVRKRTEASLVIWTDMPAGHVLNHYFPGIRSVPPRLATRVGRGRSLNPRRLTRLSLPSLVGVATTGPAPIPPVSPEPASDGSIILGQLVSPITGAALGDAWVSPEVLTRGTLVAGTTGSGKTNTVLNLLRQLNGHVWILAFDVKREYRCLHRSIGAKVFGFSGKNVFSHNLLKPEGPPSLWIKQFADILSEVINRYAPASGSKDVVIEELDRLFRERGVYDGSPNYPHVGDLVTALEARSENRSTTREGGWIASALRVLRSLQIGATQTAFCVREGLALERILQGVNVIELDGLGDKAASSLLVSVLLQKIRNHFANGAPEATLRGLFVVEEGQNFLAQGQESTSVLATTCREIRSYGIGLVYVTQMPSEFSKHAMANVNTLITHKLVHPTDKSTMANMLGLEPEQKGLIDDLRVGEALVKTEQLALVRVPRQERPLVRDDELPAMVVSREDVAGSFAQRAAVSHQAVGLPPRVLEVFDVVAEATAIHPTAISETLGFSRQEVATALSTLISKGLAAYCTSRRHGRGRPRSVYFLMPFGEELYRQRHGRYPDRVEGVSPNHAAMVAAVVAKLQISRLPHARFDILFQEGTSQRAIEVETGSNNNVQLLENLRKSLEFQQEGRFLVASPLVANRVLQVAAREAFSSRRAVLVKLATFDELPAWESQYLEPVPSTS